MTANNLHSKVYELLKSVSYMIATGNKSLMTGS